MATCLDYEDPFDDDGEDERCLQENEWSRNRASRVKEGYVDGLTAGQDLTLQQGFNEGYRDAAVLAAEIAKVKGSVCALLSYHLIKNTDLLGKEAEADFQRLLSDISQIQGAYLTGKRGSVTGTQNSELSNILTLAKRLKLIDTQTNDAHHAHSKNDVKTEHQQSIPAVEYTNPKAETEQNTESSKPNRSEQSKSTLQNDPCSFSDFGSGETTFVGKSSTADLQHIQEEFQKLISLYRLPNLVHY